MEDPKVIEEAVKKLFKDSPERKFTESVDIAVNLKDIDFSIPKNRITEEIILPKGRGREMKIGIFASGELAIKSKDVADIVITPEEIDDLADDKREAKKIVNGIDFFLAEAPLMPTIGKSLGVVLGPSGKMPKPIPPNADPTTIVNNLRSTVRLRSKERLTFHCAVGTRDMKPGDVTKNIEAVMKRIESKLERGHFNIRSVYLSTTMGPSVKLT